MQRLEVPVFPVRAGMNLSGAARGPSVLGRHARYLAAGLTGFTFADTFGDVIRNTIRQEQALAQVEARIRSTGNAAGPSSADIQRMGFPRTRRDRPKTSPWNPGSSRVPPHTRG